MAHPRCRPIGPVCPVLLALLPLVQMPRAAAAQGKAGAEDFEDAPAPPPSADAAAGLAGLPPDGLADAMPPLAAAVGGLVEEARSAQLAAVAALRAEEGEARTRAIERIPAVQLLRSRIDAAKTAKALLRLENAELQQELSRWRDTASRVAAHEARVAQLLSLQNEPPLAAASAPAAAAPPAASAEAPAVPADAAAADWASASLMQRAAQLLEAQPPSGLFAAGTELLVAPLLAGALLLLCWWRGRGGAGAAKALSCSLSEEGRPLSQAPPPPLAGHNGYGAGGYAAHGGRGRGSEAEAEAPEGGAGAGSVAELLRASAEGLGRSAGLSACAVEISDIQISNVITGGDVYVSVQVGAAAPAATEAVARPQGRGARFRAVLTVEAWRFGGGLQLRVLDRYTSREVTAAQLELSARELLGLAEREDRHPVCFDLQRPGAPGPEPPRGSRRPQVSLRLRLLPLGLPPRDAMQASPGGFVDEDDSSSAHDV